MSDTVPIRKWGNRGTQAARERQRRLPVPQAGAPQAPPAQGGEPRHRRPAPPDPRTTRAGGCSHSCQQWGLARHPGSAPLGRARPPTPRCAWKGGEGAEEMSRGLAGRVGPAVPDREAEGQESSQGSGQPRVTPRRDRVPGPLLGTAGELLTPLPSRARLCERPPAPWGNLPPPEPPGRQPQARHASPWLAKDKVSSCADKRRCKETWQAGPAPPLPRELPGAEEPQMRPCSLHLLRLRTTPTQTRWLAALLSWPRTCLGTTASPGDHGARHCLWPDPALRMLLSTPAPCW